MIDENPADLKDYGLATPRIAIDFKAAGDKDYRRLLIGEKSPTGADLFAKRNDEKKVFLIPASQESTLNRSTFDLRDKTLLKFEREKVDGISVDAGGKTVQLTKDNAEWKITQPLQARADYGSVEGLIGRLQTTGMKSIVSDNPTPAELKQYGLDKPAATVDLKLGSARATLAVGGKAADNTVYARDASKPMVVTIDSALADELKKGADDYRRKDLFEFRPYNATRVEITRNTQTIAFEKVKGRGRQGRGEVAACEPDRRRRGQGQGRFAPQPPVEHARRVVCRRGGENRHQHAGDDGGREVRRRQERRTGDLRQGGQRRLCRASRRARRGKGGRDGLHGSEQNPRRAREVGVTIGSWSR